MTIKQTSLAQNYGGTFCRGMEVGSLDLGLC